MSTPLGHWIAVGLGGALGAVARFGVSAWVMRCAAATPAVRTLHLSAFPLGTLTVNACGSLLLGFLMGLHGAREALPPALHMLFAVGFCGAFTTFSTFSYETLIAFRGNDPRIAFANIAIQMICCLAVCWIGLELGRRF